jgi:hypothetical protein
MRGEEQAALFQSLSIVRLLCLLVYNGKTRVSNKQKKNLPLQKLASSKTCLSKKKKTSLETKKNAVLNAPHEKFNFLKPWHAYERKGEKTEFFS